MAIAAVLLAIASSAVTAEPVRTLTPDTLRIGTYFVNPPFEYAAEGKDVGFEVDLMDEVARRAGLKPTFVKMGNNLQETQDGLYGCIVGGVTITRKREKEIAGYAYVLENGRIKDQSATSSRSRTGLQKASSTHLNG